MSEDTIEITKENLESSLENQPVWRTIRSLQERSKYNRIPSNVPSCTVEKEGRAYKIERIESSKDETLGEVYQLLVDTFGPEEVESEEILRNAVDGLTPFGAPEDTKYKIYVIKDQDGKVASFLNGGLFDLLDSDDNPTGEMVFLVAYVVTNPNLRQGGLAREAYISALIDASCEAQVANKKLLFAAGEAKFTSELFWNNVGWKRIYVQKGSNKKEYSELEYIQPALAFDQKTGEVAEGAGEIAEHLMVDRLGQPYPDKTRLLQVVDALYRWSHLWPIEAFYGNIDSYQQNLNYLANLKREFQSFLEAGDRLIYLDQTNRQKAQQKGITVHEYVEADRYPVGDEDF